MPDPSDFDRILSAAGLTPPPGRREALVRGLEDLQAQIRRVRETAIPGAESAHQYDVARILGLDPDDHG